MGPKVPSCPVEEVNWGPNCPPPHFLGFGQPPRKILDLPLLPETILIIPWSTRMKTPQHGHPYRVMPYVLVILPKRPTNTHHRNKEERWDRQTDTHTDGTDFIPLTADVGGNKMPFNCICCIFKGRELMYTIFWGKPVNVIPQLQKYHFF